MKRLPARSWISRCSPSGKGRPSFAPGVLFEETYGDGMLSGEVAMVDLAGWLALTVISGVVGNAAYDAIKAKVVGVVTAFRRKQGQAKLDELKQYVFDQMKPNLPNGKLTEEELKARIDAFFAEIRG